MSESGEPVLPGSCWDLEHWDNCVHPSWSRAFLFLLWYRLVYPWWAHYWTVLSGTVHVPHFPLSFITLNLLCLFNWSKCWGQNLSLTPVLLCECLVCSSDECLLLGSVLEGDRLRRYHSSLHQAHNTMMVLVPFSTLLGGWLWKVAGLGPSPWSFNPRPFSSWHKFHLSLLSPGLVL